MKQYIKYLASFLVAAGILVPTALHAQQQSQWFLGIGPALQPVSSLWGLRIPSLANSSCIGANASGTFFNNSGSCGGGGGGGGNVIVTAAGVVANSIPFWVTNASSTLSPTSTLSLASGVLTQSGNFNVFGVVSSTQLRTPSSTIGTLTVTSCVGCTSTSTVTAIGTAGYLPFYTATSTLSPTSTVFQSGLNLGVGITAPSSTLHVGGTGIILPLGDATTPALRFQGDLDSGIFAGSGLLQVTDQGTPYAAFDYSGSGLRFINGWGLGWTNGTTLTGTLDSYITRAGAGALRIGTTLSNASGTLYVGTAGIGTSQPSSTLHVIGTFQLSSVTSSIPYATSTGQFLPLAIGSGLSLTAGTLSATGGGGVATTTPFTAGYSAAVSSSLALTNSLLFNDFANSRVGIGTTAPSSTLHVIGGITSSNLANNGRVVFTDSTGLLTNSSGLTFNGSNLTALAQVSITPSANASYLTLNGAGYPGLTYQAGTQTTATPFLGTNNAQLNGWVIAEGADTGFNFAHPAQTDPTLFIHSHNQNVSQYLALAHDGSSGLVYGGDGVGTDIAGLNLTVSAGRGTGTGAGGSLFFQTTAASGTSAVANTAATRMTIDSTGKVGIGTVSPSSTLHVVGTSTFRDGNLTVGTGAAGALFTIGTNGTISSNLNGTFVIGHDFGGNVLTHTNNSLLSLNPGNNGSTQVNPALGGGLNVFSIIPSINYTGATDWTALNVNVTENSVSTGARVLANFQDNNVSRFFVNATGTNLVGINTSQPSSTLHVIGSIRAYGSISSPINSAGNANGVEAFGQTATCSGPFCVALGYGANAGTNTNNTAIGGQSTVNASAGTAVGASAISGSNGVAIGVSASANAADAAVVIGSTATAASNGYCNAIGYGATCTASQQQVFTTFNGISQSFFGNGVTNASPVSHTFSGTGGLGTDKVGASLTIQAGIGTGTGGSGSIFFNTAPTSTTSATANVTSTRMTITPQGSIGIGTTAPSSTLHVVGTSQFSATSTFAGRALFAAGTAANPSISFSANPTGGFYRWGVSGDDVAVAAGGTGIQGWANGNVIFNTTAPVSWSSSGLTGSVDIGFSRSSAGVLALGSGAGGSNIAGTLITGRLGLGNSSPSSTLHITGNVQFSASSTVVTPSIGGGLLTVGTCASATSSIDTSVTSSTAAFVTTPQNDIGDGFSIYTNLQSSGVIITRVCATATLTPTATSYVVKIIK